jgi:CDP-diacylglycerol---serine O-phosphatidyltransferase
MKNHIPNFITSLNLVSGFAAIILAVKGDVVSASWFIAASMIFDFFDGFSARLLKAYSDIGKELDSLADIVSFGVAPALIIYNFLAKSISPESQQLPGFNLMMLVPAIMPVCGAFRLAIFNLDSTQATSFKGMPIPANAIAVISLVFAGHYTGSEIIGSVTGSPVIIILLTLLLSTLMVSRLDMFSLKISNFKFKGNEGRYLMAILIVAVFALFGIVAAALIIPIYIISSLVSRYF